MKITKYFALLIVVILAGCNKITISTEDKKSIEEVQKFYGGYIETSKGIETFNTKSNSYFEVIIKNSNSINSQPQRVASKAANIAFMIFKNQSSDSYDVIKTTIILSDGTKVSKSFSKNDLLQVENLYPELEKLNSFLITKNYDGITEMFDPKFKPKEGVVENALADFDKKFGDLKRIQFQGFEFIDDSVLGHTVLMRQVGERNNVFPFMNMAFDRNTKKLLNIEFP
ncbi:hypothetical protein BA768_18935 [Chryseobacterium sp. CBo1]|uniref:hypothetical protein n=1 Tax=Chryseobacterium sp. CBo1 TaxID=1869230 RepID=UPI0008108E9B|nr:hypothetical protein [Chryseobacterium sp. CBo1]OCK50792.1 hypothetical protein BA768_18935 [Chryseobacterium sp. CBo1]